MKNAEGLIEITQEQINESIHKHRKLLEEAVAARNKIIKQDKQRD